MSQLHCNNGSVSDFYTLSLILKIVGGSDMSFRPEMEYKEQKLDLQNLCIALGMIMTDFGLRNVRCEKSLYVFSHKDEHTIVMVSNDDLL